MIFLMNTVDRLEQSGGLSKGLVDHSLGVMIDIAKAEISLGEGIEIIPDANTLPRVSYTEIERILGINGVAITKTFDYLQVDSSSLAINGLTITGARIIAEVTKGGNSVWFPGVITPGARPKVTLQTTMLDRRNPKVDKVVTPLSGMQQQLLDAALAQSLEGVGTTHGSGGAVNVGEIGHGALLASSTTSTDIHRTTHQLGFSGRLAAAVSTKMGIQTKNGVREVATFPAELTDPSIGKIYFVANHQIGPSGSERFTVFEAGAGLVLAAVSTRDSSAGSQPNIAANIRGMRTKLDIGMSNGGIHAH